MKVQFCRFNTPCFMQEVQVSLYKVHFSFYNLTCYRWYWQSAMYLPIQV